MKAKIFDITGANLGDKLEISDDIFGRDPNEHAMFMDVKLTLAARRTGNHKAKERAEVTGSTRKIKKQKGTGTARAGSIKSPLFKGGGTVFGPRVRSYDFKLNKKLKKLARKSALSQKLSADEIVFLKDFDFETPKTKAYLDVLKAFSVEGTKTLILVKDLAERPNVFLSVRNIESAKCLPLSEMNTYEILNAKKVFITESALNGLNEILN